MMRQPVSHRLDQSRDIALMFTGMSAARVPPRMLFSSKLGVRDATASMCMALRVIVKLLLAQDSVVVCVHIAMMCHTTLICQCCQVQSHAQLNRLQGLPEHAFNIAVGLQAVLEALHR